MNRHSDVHRERGQVQRGIMGMCAAILVALLLVGGTLAYFTTSSSATADADLHGGTKLQLSNDDWQPAYGQGADSSGLAPGDYVRDRVSITNLGSDCYLRMRLRIVKGSVDSKVDPKSLADAKYALDADVIDRIVATLYNDLGAGESSTNFPGGNGSGKTLSRSAVPSVSTLGYVLKRSELAADATSFDSGATPTLGGNFRNVTSLADYEKGLLTFEYVGGTGGVLASGAPSGPLITNIYLPSDEVGSIVAGEADETGKDVGYSLIFWGESVPASDYDSAAEAMRQLEIIYPASSYLPATG